MLNQHRSEKTGLFGFYSEKTEHWIMFSIQKIFASFYT